MTRSSRVRPTQPCSARITPRTPPSWNSPDGFRIAYIEGRQLRIIAGDGTGDSPLVGGVDSVRPAWKPGPAYDLVYARLDGRVEAVDTRSGDRLFSYTAPARVEGLEWSDKGSRLLVWTRRSLEILDADGRVIWSYSPKPGRYLDAAALRPGSSRQLILLEGGRQSRVILAGPRQRPRVLLAAGELADPIWSPGGRQLMVAWPEADQWLFLRGAGLDRVDVLSDVSRQFSPGSSGEASFPRATGWCCSR